MLVNTSITMSKSKENIEETQRIDCKDTQEAIIEVSVFTYLNDQQGDQVRLTHEI